MATRCSVSAQPTIKAAAGYKFGTQIETSCSKLHLSRFRRREDYMLTKHVRKTFARAVTSLEGIMKTGLAREETVFAKK